MGNGEQNGRESNQHYSRETEESGDRRDPDSGYLVQDEAASKYTHGHLQRRTDPKRVGRVLARKKDAEGGKGRAPVVGCVRCTHS